MKAIVLCAGAGTRLRPLTHTGAKHLIPVANKPILAYALETLVDAGIDEIGIVVGATGWQIQEAVGDGSAYGCQVTYIPQEKPLGLGHAVNVTRDFVGDDRFIVYLGDNFIRDGMRDFVQRFSQGRAAAQILLSREKDPTRFGVAVVEEDRIARLVEKPKVPPSDLCIVGVYAFSPQIFNAIDQTLPSARGEVEITDAIQWLIDANYEVSWAEVKSWWKDTGKPEDVLDLNRLLLEDIETDVAGDVDNSTVIEGRVIVAAGASISGSHLRGPVIIGPECSIRDAYIGPFTSVGPRTTISRCEVENSIILHECTLDGISGRLDSSLLGANVVIASHGRRPVRYKFVLADQSQVDLP